MTAPGVYAGMTEATYFGDAALSNSGAKLLLPPSCPALYKWHRDNARPPKREFDIGHVFHEQVLGVGGAVEILQTDAVKATKDTPATIGDAKNRMSNYTKAHDKEIRAAGKIPLLRKEFAAVQAMVAAVRAHPIAGELFDSDRGRPEQSLFWRDDRHGINRRCRIDWTREPINGRLFLADLKSSVSASPATFGKRAHDLGYAQQDAFYTDGAVALDMHDDPAFVFVVVEKTPPHLVTVMQLDETAKEYGRQRNALACEVFADCLANDTWPDYCGDDIPTISLPSYATRDLEYA